ncbi:MAG: 16S rRNA (cytidine(1402)-2'-O)-methyltransferase, partial [Oscillospiraceae bacterium]|nr:16S rRNA (cytidine(1402)-2'-O)-methyltransferase [Oscillospiraceae bacterium]
EVRKTTLSEALAYYEKNVPRGEFVLVIAGAQDSQQDEKPALDAVIAIAKERIEQGERASDVCRELAAETGYPKRALYQAVVQ